MTTAPLPFAARIGLAWTSFFRLLLDGAYARRVADLGRAPQLPESTAIEPGPDTVPSAVAPWAPLERDLTPALQLLGLLQREGRLVDFAQQDVTTFSDADVGAAARVVHEGVRKVLREHAQIEAVRDEAEGAAIDVPEGFDAASVKLVGNVQGAAPYRGTLRHKGWRATSVSLPSPLPGHDARVLAPAEVEL